MENIKTLFIKIARNLYEDGIPLSSGFNSKKTQVYEGLFEISYASPHVEADGTVTVACFGDVSGVVYKTKGVTSNNRIAGQLDQSVAGGVFLPSDDFVRSIEKSVGQYLLDTARVTDEAKRSEIIDRLIEDIINNVPVKGIYKEIKHRNPKNFDVILKKYHGDLYADLEELVVDQESYKFDFEVSAEPIPVKEETSETKAVGKNKPPHQNYPYDESWDLAKYEKKQASLFSGTVKLAFIAKPSKGQKVSLDLTVNPYAGGNGADEKSYENLINEVKTQLSQKGIDLKKNPIMMVNQQNKAGDDDFWVLDALDSSGKAQKVVVYKQMMEKALTQSEKDERETGMVDVEEAERAVDESMDDDDKQLVDWLTSKKLDVREIFSDPDKIKAARAQMAQEQQDPKEQSFLKAMKKYNVPKQAIDDPIAYINNKAQADKLYNAYTKQGLDAEIPNKFISNKKISDSPNPFDAIFVRTLTDKGLDLSPQYYANFKNIEAIFNGVQNILKKNQINDQPSKGFYQQKYLGFVQGVHNGMINDLLTNSNIPLTAITNLQQALQNYKAIIKVDGDVNKKKIATPQWVNFIKQLQNFYNVSQNKQPGQQQGQKPPANQQQGQKPPANQKPKQNVPNPPVTP